MHRVPASSLSWAGTKLDIPNTRLCLGVCHRPAAIAAAPLAREPRSGQGLLPDTASCQRPAPGSPPPRPGVTEVKAPKPAGQSGDGGGASEAIAAAGLGQIAGGGLGVNEPSCQPLNSAGQTVRTIEVKTQFSLNEIWGNDESILVFVQDTGLVTEHSKSTKAV